MYNFKKIIVSERFIFLGILQIFLGRIFYLELQRSICYFPFSIVIIRCVLSKKQENL